MSDQPKHRLGVWVIATCVVLLLALVVVTLMQRLRMTAGQMTMRNNLKQCYLAFSNCESTNDRLPTAYHYESENLYPLRLTDRLSWRVTLLPYIECGNGYKFFDRTASWDHPRNLSELVPYGVYEDPEDTPTRLTPYRVFHDNGALFDTDPASRIALATIPDGASSTILIAESTVRVPWTQCDEHPFDPTGPLPELGRTNRDSFHIVLADGSVKTMRKSVNPATLRAAITRDGKETSARTGDLARTSATIAQVRPVSHPVRRRPSVRVVRDGRPLRYIFGCVEVCYSSCLSRPSAPSGRRTIT